MANDGAWPNNSSGYTLEVMGTPYLKTSVPTFADLKELLSEEKWSGIIKITRSWDQFELFSGEIADVRRKIGVSGNQKRPGLLWAKIFR